MTVCHASNFLTSCLERLPFLRVDRLLQMGSLICPRRRQVPQRPGLYRSRERDHDPRAQLPRLLRVIHSPILHLLVPPVHDDLS